MGWLLATVALAGLAYGLHRFAVWAGDRELVYYKTKPRFRGSSLGLLETIYHPAMEHVVEERVSEQARRGQDESGAPPTDRSAGPSAADFD